MVIVLDNAPIELVRLAGFLEAKTSDVTVDLITVLKYDVDGTEILVPQRVDMDHAEATVVTATKPAGNAVIEGLDEFLKGSAAVPESKRELVARMVGWAKELEAAGLCGLWSYYSPRGYASLMPRLRDEGVGFATIWSTGAFTPWRSVFERRAPSALKDLDAVAPQPIGKGSNVDPTTEVLAVTRAAYEEATS